MASPFRLTHRRLLRVLIPILWLLNRSSNAANPSDTARPVYFETDFEKSNPFRSGAEVGRIERGYRSEAALAIERKPGNSDASSVSVELPAASMRGALVLGSVMVRATNVSQPPQSWNGIKCMLAIEAPDRKLWPQASVDAGSFDWRRVAFSARIPTNATSVRLVLGLEAVTGKVWFDDMRVVCLRPPAFRPDATGVTVRFPPASGPRLRGVMVSPDIDAEGLRVLGTEWKANLIRWQLVRHARVGDVAWPDGFDAWLEGALRRLDAALPACEANGLRVVVDLHSPPGGKPISGGYVAANDRLFSDPTAQARFVSVWESIARRYRGVPAIWGFDLVNEPVEDLIEEGCDDWQGLAERAARAIRAIDPGRTLIVEPAAWGGPDGLRDLAPLPFSNVVYSVHMYQPHAFTHQGVYGNGPAWRYPGVIEGRTWGREQLEAALEPVVAFHRSSGARIYIGEFSAIRWAPDDSAERYLRDLIEIFEARSWDWSYHAFREWQGWSVEHGSDRNDTKPAAAPTGRQRLLRQWFGRNEASAR